MSRHGSAASIVDDDAWLDIIAIDVKANAGALVLYRFRFDLHAPGDELLSLKDRRNPVQHVVSRFLHIVGYHVFKGKHSLYVHIRGFAYLHFPPTADSR